MSFRTFLLYPPYVLIGGLLFVLIGGKGKDTVSVASPIDQSSFAPNLDKIISSLFLDDLNVFCLKLNGLEFGTTDDDAESCGSYMLKQSEQTPSLLLFLTLANLICNSLIMVLLGLYEIDKGLFALLIGSEGSPK